MTAIPYSTILNTALLHTTSSLDPSAPERDTIRLLMSTLTLTSTVGHGDGHLARTGDNRQGTEALPPTSIINLTCTRTLILSVCRPSFRPGLYHTCTYNHDLHYIPNVTLIPTWTLSFI